MNSKITVCAALFVSGVMYAQDWMSDRRMAADLMANGTSIDTDRATLWFENGQLTSDEMKNFADLVNQGIQDIEAYLGVTRTSTRKIRYFICTQVEISHSRFQSIYLPLSKVQNRTAPYLHETTHILAPCDRCPMWFSEGLASFVQSYVSEHTGGYDGQIFSRRGNQGIDQDARRWMSNDRGRAVVTFVGTNGEPPGIDDDRRNVAAPFYVMGQSLVKFIIEHAAPEKLRPCYTTRDFDSELEQATGKTGAEWKDLWLAQLAR